MCYPVQLSDTTYLLRLLREHKPRRVCHEREGSQTASGDASRDPPPRLGPMLGAGDSLGLARGRRRGAQPGGGTEGITEPSRCAVRTLRPRREGLLRPECARSASVPACASARPDPGLLPSLPHHKSQRTQWTRPPPPLTRRRRRRRSRAPRGPLPLTRRRRRRCLVHFRRRPAAATAVFQGPGPGRRTGPPLRQTPTTDSRTQLPALAARLPRSRAPVSRTARSSPAGETEDPRP